MLRRHAFIFALRCVPKDGLFRAEFEAMVARNGGIKIKALTALSRQVLKIMYTVARERRPFVRHHVPHPVATPIPIPTPLPAPVAPPPELVEAKPRRRAAAIRSRKAR